MKTETICTASNEVPRLLPALTAGTVTVAVFAKSFVPFYLIGSTPIFAVTCLLGLALTTVILRELRDNAAYATGILVTFGLLYAVVIANYFAYSSGRVPVTHLLGILIFHALFLLFGFAGARALSAVYAVLLAQAAVYVIVIVQYVARFGDLMADGYLHDVFGVGTSSVFMTTFHQQIGDSLGLAVLAGLGLGSKRFQIAVLTASPFVFLFMFHIASRAAMAALVSGLFFWACANLWIRSRQVALLSFIAIVVVGIVTLGAFYRYAVQDKAVDAQAPDAISRTIREIQSQDPGFRLPIWQRTLSRIAAQPDHLLFGRGIGSFPIDEGAGAPDWLLRKTEGARYHPHNIHLDLLYETGLVGMLIFGALTMFPLVALCGYWSQFSSTERSAIAIYVFSLVGVELSGSFAFDYGFQFFLALAIGTVVLKRKKLAEAGGLPSTYPCEASA